MKNIISTFKRNFRFLQLCTMFLFALAVIPAMSVHAETISGNDSTSNLPVIYPDSPFSSNNNFDVRLTKEEYDSLLPVFDSSYDNYFKSELELRGQQTPDSFITNVVFWTSALDSETTYFQSNDSGESVVRSKVSSRHYLYGSCLVNSYSADYNSVGYCFIYDEEYNTAHPDTNSRYYRLYRLKPDSNSFDEVMGKPYIKLLYYQYDSGSSSVNNVKSKYTSSPSYSSSDIIVNFNNDYALEVGSNSTKNTVVNSMFCNVPIFETRKNADKYFRFHDASGVINPDGYIGSENGGDVPDENDIGNFRLYGVKCNKILSKLGLTNISWNGVTNDGWSHLADNKDTYVVPTFYTYDNKGSDKVFGMDELDVFSGFTMNLRFNKGDIINGDTVGFSFNWSDLYDELNKKGYFWDGDIWLTPIYVYQGQTVTGKPAIVDSYTGDVSQVVIDKDGNEVIKPVNPNTGLVEDEDNDLPDDGSIPPDVPPDDSSGNSSNILDFLMEFIGNLPKFIKYLVNIFYSLLSWVGSLPAFMSSVFTFLPYEIHTVIYGTILVICFVSLIKAVIR